MRKSMAFGFPMLLLALVALAVTMFDPLARFGTGLPPDEGLAIERGTTEPNGIEVWVRGQRRLGLKLGIDPLRGVPVVIALPEVDGEVELASPGLIEVGDQLLLVGGRVFESLERIDANHDGRLSRSEVRAAMRRMGMEINAALPDVLAAKLSTLGLANMPARAAGAAGRFLAPGRRSASWNRRVRILSD